MATYQEQLEKSAEARVSNTRKAMVALAEMNAINDALGLLERDGILPLNQRFEFLRAFVLKHPEINKAIGEADRCAGDGGDAK